MRKRLNRVKVKGLKGEEGGAAWASEGERRGTGGHERGRGTRRENHGVSVERIQKNRREVAEMGSHVQRKLKGREDEAQKIQKGIETP